MLLTDLVFLPTVATGIVLILASLIFRYGAELEERNRLLLSDREKGAAIEAGENL